MKQNNYNTISLAKFLARYAYLEGEALKRLKHNDVKENFTFIKRCSFKNAEKLKDSSNMIIYVNDGEKIVPYIIPEIYYKYDYFTKINPVKAKTNMHSYTNYLDMPTYELIKLLNKKFLSYKKARMIRRELYDRKISLKKSYKLKKDKEMYENKLKDYFG